jgi:outer membrane protein
MGWAIHSQNKSLLGRTFPTGAAAGLCLCVLSSVMGRAQNTATLAAVEQAAVRSQQVPPALQAPGIDPAKPYTLAELIDMAEQSNPKGRIAWEHAKQTAEHYGIARDFYLPVLVSNTLFADERIINPFPKPLAPRGYVMVEIPTVQPQAQLSYLLFDFGGREAKVDAAAAARLQGSATLLRVNQDIAFQVSEAYYRVLTAEGRLRATDEILQAARTVQDAAEQQLKNGRSTLPDVLNARAATAQAAYERENADGDLRSSKVLLREAIGAEPSPEIEILDDGSKALPEALNSSIEELIGQAFADRPDLLVRAQEVRVAHDEVRQAKAAYLPSIGLEGAAAQTSMWPTVDYGQLGNVSQTTWSGSLNIRWEIFNRARKHEDAIAASLERQAGDELRESKDAVTRDVWNAYISYQTAQRRNVAATALLDAANLSYTSSLDAYRYGVKNLIDVVSAQQQLAQAKLACVQARSDVLLDAIAVDYSTGVLLRTGNKTAAGVSK